MGLFEKLAGSRTFRIVSVTCSLGIVLALLCAINCISRAISVEWSDGERWSISRKNASSMRKLLQTGDDGSSNRIGSTCSREDISVYQGVTSPLPNGIPTYAVQVLNVCTSGCTISDIHFSCGWFSSARMINPKVFRRITYDNCLVNNGEPLPPGGSLAFDYANSFQYPLSVSYVKCY